MNDLVIWREGLVLAMGLVALAAALSAAASRSLAASIAQFAVAAGATAAALLLRRLDDAALAEAVIGLGVSPFILFATMLLTTRTAKARNRPIVTLGAVASCLMLAAALWIALAPAPWAPAAKPGTTRTALLWLAPLVSVIACIALGGLGLGERGALSKPAQAGQRDQ